MALNWINLFISLPPVSKFFIFPQKIILNLDDQSTEQTNKPTKSLHPNRIVPIKDTTKDQKDTQNLYFTVAYTKDIKKKKKRYSDGILEIQTSKVKIYDSDGGDVYSTFKGKLFKDMPKNDEEYYFGSYLSNMLFGLLMTIWP